MQEQEEIGRQVVFSFKLSLFSVINRFVLLLFIIGSSTLLYSSSTMTSTLPRLSSDPVASKTVALNGADSWDDDRTVTTPAFDFSQLDNQALKVSPLFERYYHRHS